MEIIRCNWCGHSHRSDFCITTGKVPSIDCAEDDTQPSAFENDIPRILFPRTRLK